VKDLYTNWRELDDGNLTATETSAAVKVGNGGQIGHTLQVTVPARNADADTLDITFTESATSGGSYALFKTMPQITGTAVAAALLAGGSLTINTKLGNTLPWVKCVMTVGGSTPNFGRVHAGLDAGVAPNLLQIGA
jgi:hypothetical protein